MPPARIASSFAAALALFAGCGGDPVVSPAADAGASAPDLARVMRDSPFLKERFMGIAHRGGATLRPEHTMVAYRHAVELGIPVFELDLHATKDGVLVAMHDDSVDRTTDGTGTISAMRFDDLRKLDAGYRFTRDGGQTHPYRGMGLTVPTLDEVLDAFPDALLAVELKQYRPSIVEAVIARFEAHQAMGRTIFAAFDDATIRALRARAPNEVTALGTGEMLRLIGLPTDEEATYVPPSDVVQPPKANVTAELVALAHRFGLKVHPWTVNSRADMEQLIDLGVDGMYTDDPETLLAVLKARGR